MTDFLARPADFAAFAQGATGGTWDPADLATLTILEAASDLARSYCGRDFGLVVNDPYELAGDGSTFLMLPDAPTYDVTAVTEVVSPGDDPTELDVNLDVQLSRFGALERIDGGCWRHRSRIIVTHSHGYLLPDHPPDEDVDAEDLPADLQMSVIQTGARLAANPSGQAISAETIGSYSVSYSEGTAAVGPETQTLDRYRFRRPG